MVVFSSLVSIRVDFVKFDSVSHRLSRAQGNGEKDLVIFLDFLGNLNLGFNVVVQSPAGLAEIRDVGHRLDVIIAPKQEMVADQQTLVLLKPFSCDPGVAKAKAPTFLEYCGIPAPGKGERHRAGADGGRELRLHLPKENADAPSRHQTQYLEMMGVQGLYYDRWMLSAIPSRAPWQPLGTAIQDPASGYKFELFDVTHDWSQYADVAAEHPRQGEGIARIDVRRVQEVSGVPAGCVGGDTHVESSPPKAAGRG
jgi:hypothetical protein